jgi:Fur family transcriptional regulator, peroxide stress response regulator
LTGVAPAGTLTTERRVIPKNTSVAAAAAESPAGALRARGLRLTGPRRVVLEVVRRTESHPTAEWVHRMVRRRLPRVSLGTVYRNLRVLVEEGLVQELPGPHTRFDGNLGRHHHFNCTTCGRILDVEGPLCEPQTRAVSARVESLTGLTITHHRIEFFGRCPACRPTAGRREPGRPRPGRPRRSP